MMEFKWKVEEWALHLFPVDTQNVQLQQLSSEIRMSSRLSCMRMQEMSSQIRGSLEALHMS